MDRNPAGQTMLHILAFQAAAGLAATTAAALQDLEWGSAVGFGCLLALGNNAALARRIVAAGKVVPAQGQRILYLGALWRFVAVMVGLGLAYWLGLQLLWVAAGMLVVQVASFFYGAGVAVWEYRRKGRRLDGARS